MDALHYINNNPAPGSLIVNRLAVWEPIPDHIVDRPNGTGDYLFMLFYGTAQLGLKQGPKEFPAFALSIWRPGDGQYYGALGGKRLHSWVHCEGSAIDRLLRGKRFLTDRPLALPNAEMMEHFLLALSRELSAYLQPDPIILENHFQNFIREIERHTGGPQSPRLPGRMLAVKQFMDANYTKPVTLAQLARRTHLSQSHFCSEFKRVFGLPAVEHIINLRMNEADYLLNNRGLSVTDIAQHVGYDDIYHFSKLFKARYGVSPRARRKQRQ